MTNPSGEDPSSALSGLGGIAAWGTKTETAYKAEAYNGLNSSFGGVSTFGSEVVSAPLFGGEVSRLDNRIDELIIGTERAIRYTYTESGVWTKHPAEYKVDVDVFSPATGGRPGAASGQAGGGFGGGWKRVTFTGATLEDLPASVAISIGAGAPGGGGDAGTTSFGTFVSALGATTTNYGEGDRTYKMRGGSGGISATILNPGGPGTGGSSGPFHPGGSGGAVGNAVPGGNGFSVGVGQVGNGSAGGGGGGSSSTAYHGGRGGHGGHPGGPGGGGGGTGGPGGNGAGGMVVVTVYVEDTLGSPPTPPSNLAVSGVTSSAAHVTWDASVDDVMVKHYILYLNGSRYGVVNTLFHDFVGLTASTAYAVRVQAVDIGDNVSELSDVLNFTTTA